jgi:hypothetical protein
MIIVLMMEAECTSETLVNIDLTIWQYIPEDSKLRTRHCENLKFLINNLQDKLVPRLFIFYCSSFLLFLKGPDILTATMIYVTA